MDDSARASAMSAAEVAKRLQRLTLRNADLMLALTAAAIPLEALLMTECGEKSTTLAPELKDHIRIAVKMLRAVAKEEP